MKTTNKGPPEKAFPEITVIEILPSSTVDSCISIAYTRLPFVSSFVFYC